LVLRPYERKIRFGNTLGARPYWEIGSS